MHTLIESATMEQSGYESEMKTRRERKNKCVDLYNSAKQAYEAIKDMELETEKQISITEREKKTLQEKMTFYKRMIDNYEGFNSNVKNSLKALRGHPLLKHIEGTVSEIIKVDKVYELAIETALGYSSQNIICDTIDSARSIIEFVKKEKTGRITLLPMSDIRSRKSNGVTPPKDEGVVGKANELIYYDKKFENIVDFVLGGVIIVKDSSTAIRLIKRGFKGSRLITIDGDVFNPGGTITGGSSKGRSAGLLTRNRIYEDSIKDINEKNRLLEKLKEDFKNTASIKILREKELKEAIDNLSGLEKSLEVLSMNIEISKKNTGGLKDRQSELIKELNESIEEKASINKEMALIENSLTEMEALNTDNAKNIEELERIEKENESVLSVLKEALNLKKVEHAIMLEKLKSIETEISRLNFSIDKLQKSNQDYQSQLKDLNLFIEKYDQDILIKRQALDDLLIQIEEMKQNNSSIGMSIDENAAMVSSTQETLDKMNEDIFKEKERYHKVEMSDTRNQMNYDHFIKQLWDVYQLSYIEAMESKTEITNRSAMSKRIGLLKKEIELLGDINKTAIREYDDVLHRYNFLSKQKSDLIEAKNTLEDLILKLEEKMVKIFKEEIKEINNNFNTTFKQLFNGGRAEIIFEDHDDILNSHIDIYAEPPGKKLQNLNLLSGGEKSLTAIAMLFAILMKKPSPFCVLDEIEAALDDVNVYRFSSFLKNFTTQAQFIIITHRKGTMEIADVLYGVTMEEKGISKIVSLEIKNKAS